MNHTPGPWYAGHIRIKGADPKMDGCDIGAENGSNVAIAFHQESDRTQAETVANARLIAAAPDLLVALIEASNVLAMLTESDDIKNTTVLHAWAAAVAVERKARAAIDKATS